MAELEVVVKWGDDLQTWCGYITHDGRLVCDSSQQAADLATPRQQLNAVCSAQLSTLAVGWCATVSSRAVDLATPR